MIDGRKKGARHMNALCRDLSLWLCPGLNPRTPVSRLPVRQASTNTQPSLGHWQVSGDFVFSPSIYMPLCIEAKDREKWNLDGLLFCAKEWPPWSWWRQAQDQARKVGRQPLLVFTRNFRKNYALGLAGLFCQLGVKPVTGPCLRVVRAETEDTVLCLLDDFLLVPPERLKKVPSSPAQRSSRR